VGESSDVDASLAARTRARATVATQQAGRWLDERKRNSPPVDLAVQLFERDRDAFGSVLGSAIALRLFLFVTALSVVVVTGLSLFLGGSALEDALSTGGITGQIASEVEGAASASTGRNLGLFLTGVFLCLTAGRSLTRVLAACSAGASGMEGRAAKSSMRVAARVAALIALLILAALLLNRLRGAYGLAIAASSLAINALVLGGTWFFVCLSLPRSTRDPGAAIPGAVTFALAITALQWFMHFYLPHKIASASEVMGSLGVTFASLGYLFLIGRVMAASLIVNAVLFDRFGSISELFFDLPLVRRVPERFPRVKEFFDLQPDRDTLDTPPR
jgi:hypothetical protein